MFFAPSAEEAPPAPPPAPAPVPTWLPAVAALLVTTTNPRGITTVMLNVLVAPAVQGLVNLGPSLLPIDTPRAAWDRQCPAATTANNWATT
ncbi:hypothetical protein BDW59DRAFT_168040 [Aspergillus cavernicola]|uniref:Uncharacterized protein n=1 Tax=Aspergillus cavernicola TaxID=176166 RepID=A0ABR4H746_9EURO